MQSTELRIKQNPKSSILKSPHIQQKIYIKELSKKKKTDYVINHPNISTQ